MVIQPKVTTGKYISIVEDIKIIFKFKFIFKKEIIESFRSGINICMSGLVKLILEIRFNGVFKPLFTYEILVQPYI